MKGIFLDINSVHPADLDFSQLDASLEQWTLPACGTATPLECIADAEVVVSNKVLLDADTIRQAPRLKLICVAATGYNNVDLAAAAESGVAVCNVRRYATPSVVQHVFALILSLTTRLREASQAAMDGRWSQSDQFCLLDFPIRELSGKTLGIVGYGELGKGVEQVAKAFGMTVLVSARPGSHSRDIPAGRIAFDELLPQADILSLHCPLSEQTRNLIAAEQLAAMKPDSLLINTARGGMVDEAALAHALRHGQIGGAGIDTLASEPPQGPQVLLQDDIPNLIVTPHNAWSSQEARQRLIDQIANNIRAWRAGTPQNLIQS